MSARKRMRGFRLIAALSTLIAGMSIAASADAQVVLPASSPSARLPVLYMPDGGTSEDFIHVAGLLQVSIGNGTMRPFILVGIENTERRRDMTGPTTVEEDRRIAV